MEEATDWAPGADVTALQLLCYISYSWQVPLNLNWARQISNQTNFHASHQDQ